MSTATLFAEADCAGHITIKVTIDAPNGTAWQVLEVWGAGEVFPVEGNDHQTAYRGTVTPGAELTIGANVRIGGQPHDADPVRVHVPNGCRDDDEATTTTTARATTTTTVAATTTTAQPTTTTTRIAETTTTTIVLDEALTTTTTTPWAIGIPTSVVASTSVPRDPYLPVTGAGTVWAASGAGLGLLVLGVLALRIGKFKRPA